MLNRVYIHLLINLVKLTLMIRVFCGKLPWVRRCDRRACSVVLSVVKRQADKGRLMSKLSLITQSTILIGWKRKNKKSTFNLLKVLSQRIPNNVRLWMKSLRLSHMRRPPIVTLSHRWLNVFKNTDITCVDPVWSLCVLCGGENFLVFTHLGLCLDKGMKYFKLAVNKRINRTSHRVNFNYRVPVFSPV